MNNPILDYLDSLTDDEKKVLDELVEIDLQTETLLESVIGYEFIHMNKRHSP